MIKKIKVVNLVPRMFIHDFNCSWTENPFFKKQVLLENETMVQKVVKQGIHEVYIDTAKGVAFEDAAPAEESEAAEPKRELSLQMILEAEASPLPDNQVPIREEVKRAAKIKENAKKIIRSVMDDVRFGKQIEMEKIEPVVEQIMGSVFRNREALIGLGKIKNKHEYTFLHSVKVCAHMVSFARSLGLDREIISEIGIGAILHDIGKMKIPKMILDKPGSLTDEEFEVVKKHVVYSREILLETANVTEIAIQLAAQHHERYDGTGYPDGLKGDEISYYGQMAAIVDVYEAITSNRVYGQAMEVGMALRHIYEWSDLHFNRKLVSSYIRTLGIYPVGSVVRLESGRIAVVIENTTDDLLKPVVRIVHDDKKKLRVNPYDVNLSKQGSKGTEDRIVCHESPKKWGFDSLDYLNFSVDVTT